MDINQIRRARLKDWIDAEYGGRTARFCQENKLPDSSESYLWQLLSGYRNIGEKAARKLETQGGKPAGWLDQPPVLTLKSDGTGSEHPISEKIRKVNQNYENYNWHTKIGPVEESATPIKITRLLRPNEHGGITATANQEGALQGGNNMGVLIDDPDAYSFFVDRDIHYSNARRGCTVVLSPKRIPKPGKDVFVETADGLAYLQLMVSETAEEIALQDNAGQRTYLKKSDITTIHVVFAVTQPDF